MNRHVFSTHLTNLAHDRFALTQLKPQEFANLYHQIINSFNITADGQDWYLIGTDGCHLCDEIASLLHQIKQTRPLPHIHHLELIDSQDDTVINGLGVLIPILLTPKQLLCYPFGIMDILTLHTHD
ncbi:hypothetical protein M2R47_05885 [Moraxella sp. Tifton1]|uniref:Thioredoxin family protein n=1 Tax=Moraxella oculi TaxID=2940516 RepID=A0ABW8U591_9GAMM|nr:hypothetical protein [Moraxella sp. Tifton1]MCL1623769.1 hypothetical protein [Moraxella sp. Tifton1]